jgi:hypothetical protein
MSEMLQIPAKVQLIVSAEQFGIIVAALRKGSYESVQPVMVELENQIRAQQPTAPKPPGEPKPLKGAKSNVQSIKSDQPRRDANGSGAQGQTAGGN